MAKWLSIKFNNKITRVRIIHGKIAISPGAKCLFRLLYRKENFFGKTNPKKGHILKTKYEANLSFSGQTKPLQPLQLFAGR